MNKHFLVITLFILLIPIQRFQAQNFGIKGGLNFPSMMAKDDEETYTDNNKMKIGFHIGGVIDYPITDELSLEGSLLLSMKGGKSVEEDGDSKYTTIINLYYLNIPLLAKYTVNVGDISLYGAAGPYFGIGISGKYKDEWEFGGESETSNEKIEWGNDSENDDFKRPDGGLHVGAGIILGQIQAGLFYELGLVNMSSYTNDGFLTKNRVFGITAAYFFNK